MSSLRELLYGDGRLDTALRALSLALFAGVALALIWTAISVQGELAALPAEQPLEPPQSIHHLEKTFSKNKEPTL